jgi:serine/threonine protein kinase
MNRQPTPAPLPEPAGTPDAPAARATSTRGDEPARSAGLARQLRQELAPDLEVLRHIGNEQFGSLYLAREATPPRLVVVKVLRQEFVDNAQAKLRFQRATRSSGRITHPNVLTVLRVGKLSNDVPFATELYVGDCTLRDRQKAVGRFAAPAVRQILRQLSSALAAAHRRGIVHRNVCPETVRCENDSDRVFLSDFGLSGILETATIDEISITNTDQLMGSPDYVSPEQARGEKLTDRADVYSLGVLGWKLLTNDAKLPDSVRKRGHLPNASLEDAPLASLISRCLRQQPNERPSASDVVAALDHGRFDETTPRPWFRWPWWMLQRRIPHFVGPYLVTGFSILAAIAMFVEMEILPRWVFLQSLTLVFAGLFAVIVIAWYHGETGKQETTWPERFLLGAILAAWISAAVFVWYRWGF